MVGDGGTVAVLVVAAETRASETAQALERASDRIEARTESDPAVALEMAASGRYDCVVCDPDVADGDVSLLASLSEVAHDPAVVVVTEAGSEATAAEAVRCDVDDYRRRGAVDAETLAACVEAAVEREDDDDDAFARMVTHDLRNPLSVATGWLDVYRESGEESQLDQVAAALDRMEAIIDDVRTLARGEGPPDRESVDLSAAATAAWEMVDPAAATLKAQYGPRIEADPSMLQAVLENLFDNAVTHGRSDVTVTVSTLADDDGFYVADDGPGIPEAERDQVFERGYSGGSGTGMGLAIVTSIAAAHDWEVTLTESEDGGTRFEFHGVSILQEAPLES